MAALLCLGALTCPALAEEAPPEPELSVAAEAEPMPEEAPAPEPEPEAEEIPVPEPEPEPEKAPAAEPNPYAFSDLVVGGRYDPVENELAICAFLREELGLNAAAASGILANIERESEFDPHCLGDDGTSYGICKWHAERFAELRSWCRREGLKYTSLQGQLRFLAHELESRRYEDVLASLRTAEDSAAGAYWAADQWCRRFELPDHVDREAESRGLRAETGFFAYYGCHRVFFDPAGGVLDEESRTILNGETWAELPTPTRRFFDFGGWMLEDGTVLAAEDTVALESNVTLYALWTPQASLADSPMLEEEAVDEQAAAAAAVAESGSLVGGPRCSFTLDSPTEPQEIIKPGRETASRSFVL